MSLELFLGIKVNPSLSQQLDLTNPFIKSMVIHEDHLQELSFEGNTYIGKKLGKTADFSYLESLETHIHSLIKKMLPHYQPLPLILFPYNVS